MALHDTSLGQPSSDRGRSPWNHGVFCESPPIDPSRRRYPVQVGVLGRSEDTLSLAGGTGCDSLRTSVIS